MVGYAIRFADLPGPWRVIGESAAGNPFSGTFDQFLFVRAHKMAGMRPDFWPVYLCL